MSKDFPKKLLNKILPKVYRSEGDMVEFEPNKIFESLIRETGMKDENATKITELVTRRIISSGIKFLSGPHIREIVCSILSEEHFEKERKYYTRIGMPLMDYEEIIENPPKKMGRFPERIHQIAANQLSIEYTYLRILSEEESQAHLYGDIYIHGLEYFDLRPSSQYWDPRLILKHGLPPIKNYQDCCKYNPAKDLEEAVLHLSKWLGMTSQEFNGLQGYNLINVFLAPYIRGKNEREILKSLRIFISELNQLNLITGRYIPTTYISNFPKVPDVLQNILAVGPNGNETNPYGDYQEECNILHNLFVKVFKEGLTAEKPFYTPKHYIYLDSNLFHDDLNERYFLDLWEEIQGPHQPVLINYRKNDEQVFHELFASKDTYINQGILQKISLNLPRYAYIAKDEAKFFEILSEKIKLSKAILDKKREIIKKRILSKQLPLCSSKYENEKNIFTLMNQKLCMGFIGLNETVKKMTGEALHESEDGYLMGLKIINKIKEQIERFPSENGIYYSLFDCNSAKVRSRFTRLDLKHFPKDIISEINGNKRLYNHSTKFDDNIKMDLITRLEKQGQFHELINNESIEFLSMNLIANNYNKLKSLANTILKNTKIKSFTFISR